MKAPAINFYTQDFLVGTMFMTDEEVGQYIRLLCIQHQHGGYISEEIFKQICKSVKVENKFKKCKDGYYNERLLNEMEKRKKYIDSRRNNFLGKENVKYENGKLIIPETIRNEICEIFPEELLEQELPKMENWLKVNKPKKNYKRFIINWLNNSNGIVKEKPKPKPKKQCQYCGEYFANLDTHVYRCPQAPPPAPDERVKELVNNLTSQFKRG